MKKKVVSLLLAAAMTTAALAGCGSSTAPLPPTHPQAPIPPAQLPLLLPQTEKKKTPQVRKLP